MNLNVDPLLLPLLQMGSYLDVFKDFYIRKHSGRKLQWQHSLANCVLRVSFDQVLIFILEECTAYLE